jgi:hypothetical protein
MSDEPVNGPSVTTRIASVSVFAVVERTEPTVWSGAGAEAPEGFALLAVRLAVGEEFGQGQVSVAH